jgi:transposase
VNQQIVKQAMAPSAPDITSPMEPTDAQAEKAEEAAQRPERSLTPLDPKQALITVIEMGKESWLVAGIIPGVERYPLKKLAPDEDGLLKLLERWRAEAEKAGHKITRIAVAFETGRDGFWLARWLRARGIEAHVIHAASVAVSREHRRAKTDRLDTEQLKRAFLGWLRGERDHCKMAAIP